MSSTKCIICEEVIEGHGNNPWPLHSLEEGECCDRCNIEKVVPARIYMLYDNG